MRISDWSSDVCSSDLVASRIFADEAGEIGPVRWNALHGHRRLRPWRQWRASKSAALAERERAATREGRMERSRALAARQIGFKADDTALLVVVHIHDNPTKISAANWKGKKYYHDAVIPLAHDGEGIFQPGGLSFTAI